MSPNFDHLESNPPVETSTQPTDQETEPTPSKGSRIISSVLSPAARLWLRSQTEHVEDLLVKIEGSDRQILSGCVNRVSIAAGKAIYQGLHLSQISLTGESIRVNLGQVLRGKPLRLLEPFPIAGEVTLQTADMNASLQAPLLSKAVIDFLLGLLQSSGFDAESAASTEHLNLKDPQVVIDTGRITLNTQLVSVTGQVTSIVIRTGLSLANPHTLQLDRPEWLPNPTAKKGLAIRDMDGMTFDLGPEVTLEQLRLEPGQIVCCGQIRVIPAE